MDKISFDDFQKIDIRIGTVVKAEIPEWSHAVIKLTVDFGGGPSTRSARSGQRVGKRTVFAGIMKWYKAKDLKGKQFPFVVNIEPKKIGPEGDTSDAMMLAVDVGEKEEERCILFGLKDKVPNGTKVH